MAATYCAVMLTNKGGPEALHVVELPVDPPGPGQLRVRVRAAGVGSTDLVMLAGRYRYAPKIPLVPGYEIAGVVDAVGTGVTGFEVGDRVAALTVYGGFAELLVREAGHFLPVPDGVSDRDAAAVILNYITAWQMIHRVAKVQPGHTALVTGAAGGGRVEADGSGEWSRDRILAADHLSRASCCRQFCAISRNGSGSASTVGS